MKFACDACQAQYMIADEKVRDRAVKVKCKKCEHVIVVRPPRTGDDGDGREGTIDGALSGATEESAQLPSMNQSDENEVDSDETHILDDDQARSAASSFGESSEGDALVPDTPPPAAHADATHVAMNPLAGMESQDFASPSDGGIADPPDSAFAPPTDLIATTQGEAIEASINDGSPNDDNLRTVVSGPGVFDDSKALGADLDLDANPDLAASDDELSPFASGEQSSGFADSSSAFADNGDDALAGFDDNNGDDMGDVPEPPSGGELEAALSQEGAPVEDPPPFMDPSANDVAGEFPAEMPEFDDETGEAVGHSDPTIAGPTADVSIAAPQLATVGEEGDDDDAQSEVPKDELDAVLAGAFNQMFSDPGSLPFPEADDEDAQRNATSVIDSGEMDVLRNQAAGDGMFRDDSSFDDLAAMGGAASEESDEPEWHVAIDDEDVGPLSLAEVRDEVTGGRVLRDSLVWKVGMDDWYPAEDIPEISDMFTSGAAAPVGAPNLAGFDVGEPVDDMGPSPFGGPENSDPFGQVENFHDDQDPSWQPHGLTDVYQAANLAEAGGAAPPPPSIDLPADDESEGGWRPGAASALSALVANEIDRIDAAPEDAPAGPLLPADDANSADGPAELSGPAMLGGIAGPELSGGIVAAPFDADLGPALDAGPAIAPYGGPLPGAGGPPAYPQAAPAGRSNVVMAIAALAALMIVMIGIVAVVAIFKWGSADNAQVATGGAGTKIAVKTPPPSPSATPPKAVDPTPKTSETPGTDPATATGSNTNKAADDATKVALLGTKPKTPVKPKPPKAENKDAVKVEPKESSRSRSRNRSRGRTATNPTPTPKPPPKPTPPKPRAPPKNTKCDPVLDFDCDEKPTRASKKRTLSKSDILSTVKKKIGTINACGRKHKVKGSVKMRWQISKSGKTRNVSTLTSKYKGKPVASCLESAIRQWKFPAYTGKSPGNIDFPFKLK